MGQAVSLNGGIEDVYFLQKVKLGQGSFGTVWRAVDRRTDEVVAVKQLDKGSMPRRGVRREDIEREIAVMRVAVHENVTRLLATFEDHKSIYLALEYCDGGDFGDKVKERGNTLQEPEAADWVGQICAAIQALHQKSVCHRDIKPDNFMVHGGLLKLADFGLALHLPHGRLLTEKCGTPAFMSPEQHRLPRHSRGYGYPCDMWAAGISMYMLMLGGRHPFLNSGQTQLDERRLIEGQLDFAANSGIFGFGIPDARFSEEARTFCKKMVNPSPSHRITAEDAIRDPWLDLAPRHRNRSSYGGPSGPRMTTSAAPLAVEKEHEAFFAKDAGAIIARAGDEIQRGLSELMAWAPFTSGENSPPKSGLFGRSSLNFSFGAADVNEQANADVSKTFQQAAATTARPTPSIVPKPVGDNQAEIDTVLLHQRIKGLEKQLELQRENMESQMEVLQQLNLERRKLAEATAKVSLASADTAMPGSSMGYMSTGSTATPTGSDTIDGILKAGVRCSYNSSSWSGWMPAVVQQFNEKDGTYNLDVRPHARLENIRPVSDISAAEAWPRGALVSYHDPSTSSWKPTVVISFNPRTSGKEGSYNLSLHDNASVDRIRPRLKQTLNM